ncbi:MAG: FGGY family carbohydrate kinase [Sideroxydans sp.]|nr:FGGY family carbohydrate kinase [Sideroxydans sp.]
MSEFLCLSLDLGTTSIKAALLDKNAGLQHLVSLPAPLITQREIYFESDALEYALVAENVLAQCRVFAGDCTTLALCSQRSSLVIWNAATGVPLTPLISWQDARGAASCTALQDHENEIRALSGLPLTPYYFAGKVRVLLAENPHWRARLLSGEYRLGTLDTFLIARWSAGKHFVTDASMAARTQLLDISSARWSKKLGELFDIPLTILPRMLPSKQMNLALRNGLILQASIGDQSAALLASIASDSTEALANLGTGCFVLRYSNTQNQHGYLNTLVYQDNAIHLAVEGTLNSTAAALAPYPAAEVSFAELAQHDIFALSEPSGVGAPYFKKSLGLTFSASIAHLNEPEIAALLLEAIIFRISKMVHELHREQPIQRLYLSGGLANLASLQQGIAQCVPCAVYRLEQTETSLLGAAMLATNLNADRLRCAQKISRTQTHPRLVAKFQAWQNWLDEVLRET